MEGPNVTTKWRACGARFAVTDVVAWAERVWGKQGRGRREKTVQTGARIVTAQVDGIEPGGLVALTVLACEILYSKWEPLKPFQRGEKIRRKRETFAKGDAHRRVGSAEEESARDWVASPFVGPESVTLPARSGDRAAAPTRGRFRGGRGKGPRPRLRPRSR